MAGGRCPFGFSAEDDEADISGEEENTEEVNPEETREDNKDPSTANGTPPKEKKDKKKKKVWPLLLCIQLGWQRLMATRICYFSAALNCLALALDGCSQYTRQQRVSPADFSNHVAHVPLVALAGLRR
jgi:hypothetical protein